MDYQEGYVDGLAGAGMQWRGNFTTGDCIGMEAIWHIKRQSDAFDKYNAGFCDGSIDRKAMLAQHERAAQ